MLDLGAQRVYLLDRSPGYLAEQDLGGFYRAGNQVVPRHGADFFR
jgi:hypothetical protein